MPTEALTPPQAPPRIERAAVPEAFHVASHELNHAIVAHELGVSIDSISIVPSGNSLGRTILGGYVDLNKIKIIAAAGAVETPYGEAIGYNSDLYKAELITALEGGISVDAAKGIAASILGKYPDRVREKAAEIIARAQTVSSPDITAIMEWARLEVNFEETGILDSRLLEKPLFSNENEPRTEQFTKIDDFEQAYRVRWIEGRKVRKEVWLCSECLGENGHFENCPILREEKKIIAAVPQADQKETDDQNQENEVSNIISFPKSKRIFERASVEDIIKKAA